MSAPGARLAFAYAALFLFAGLALPFWPVWLESHGLGAVEIGFVLAIGRWIVILASPLLARLADRSGERRRPLILLAAGLLASYSLYLVGEGVWQFVAIAALVAVFQGPMVPLTDSLALMQVRVGRVDYGRVRLWGSLSFIGANLLGGVLVQEYVEEAILWAILGSIVLVLVACLLLPDDRVEPATIRWSAILRLAFHPIFGTFLLTVALLQGSHAVLYAFASVHWRAAGIADATIGWLWAEGVIAEIVLFFVGASWSRRLGPGGMMVLAAAAGVLRWMMLGLGTDLPVLMAAQLLHAFTFGAAHLGAMAFIARAAPAPLSATAQSLYSALAMGATFALVLPFAAPLYAAVGASAFFAMAGLSLVGGLAAAILARLWQGRVLAV